MASSVALNASVVAPATAPMSLSDARTGSSRHAAHDDFARPLHEARKQHASSVRNTTSSHASSAPPKSKALSSRDAARDDEKDKGKPTKSDASDATTAMLALLGQSVPAMAAPTSAAGTATVGGGGGGGGGGGDEDAGQAGNAVTANSVLANTLPVTIPGLMPPTATATAPQPATDNAGDDASAVDGLKDNALAALAGDVDDPATAALASVAAGDSKADGSGRAPLAVATQGDRSDPLDALRAMTASPFMQQPVTAQPAAPAHALSMNSAVGSPSFAQELGQQVAWIGGQDIKQARIRLHPEDLGQLDVKVSVQHDHVDVSFIAQHPQAVHAVQQTLGQLDAMLAHNGLSLGHAEVGQGGRGGDSGQGGSLGASSQGDAEPADGGAVASVESAVVSAMGLLDTFA